MSYRLLLASIHSYLDPSSGAALATPELHELLATRGWDCRALTCGVLDYQNETPIEIVLASIERPAQRSGAALSLGGEVEVFDLDVDGVHVTLLPTSSSRADKAPNPREGGMYLDLATAGASPLLALSRSSRDGALVFVTQVCASRQFSVSASPSASSYNWIRNLELCLFRGGSDYSCVIG